MLDIQTRDMVRLLTPENPRLHGATAQVLETTEWGAIVATSAAATGRFRALYSEMVPLDLNEVGTVRQASTETVVAVSDSTLDTVAVVIKQVGSTNGWRLGHAHPAESRSGRDLHHFSHSEGYTGDVCSVCQGSRMRHNGSCLVCDDCGSTTGCS